MGWYSTPGATKAQVIQEILADHPSIVAHQVVGHCLWAVHPAKEGGNFIALFLLDDCGGGWGYKPMDESMHPYYYSCPREYLEQANVGVNAEWRARVRSYQ